MSEAEKDETGIFITPLWLAKRYMGVCEYPGAEDHPAIQWWLQNAGLGRNQQDEIPWCGAFVGNIAWELDLERPDLPVRARHWLSVGRGEVPLELARPGFDIVILMRGGGPPEAQPGPGVLNAPGHVGFFTGLSVEGHVVLLGGNQSDKVTEATFPRERVLGVRRLRRLRRVADAVPGARTRITQTAATQTFYKER